MTAIWHNGGSGWQLLAPSGFPAEAALHDLVEEAPQLLPLAGTPRLTVLGREVLLGGNYADLVAVEPTGRVVVIEIKLARNAEARRAVIAQILTYAAFLRGMDPVALEQNILVNHLRRAGFERLFDAVAASDQEGAFDLADFNNGLEQSLRDGHFRLVLVLDDAPVELVRLVGYLEAITDGLVIDLVTVASYDVGGSTVIVPQRVDPELPVQREKFTRPPTQHTKTQGHYVDGAADFVSTIDFAPAENREVLRKMADWAVSLEQEGLAKLGTYHGTSGRWTLLPRLIADNVGLITIWNDGGGYLQFWRSVFDRRAPNAVIAIEDYISPIKVGQGNVARTIDDRLLTLLADAYREAAGKPARS